MTTVREQVLKHVVSFSFASIIGGVGGFLASYFAARVLGPTLWGVWLGAKLVLVYGVTLQLGVRDGMHREVPILRGRKNVEKQASVINATFSFSLVAATVVSLGVLLSTFILRLTPELKISLRFIAGMIFLMYIQTFYAILFRVYNEFSTVSWLSILDGLGNVLSVILTLFYGLMGFLWGQLLRLVVVVGFSYWKSSFTLNWSWNRSVLKALILIGFPIMIINLTEFALTTVDRLLILRFLNSTALGLYGLGNLTFTPVLMLLSVGSAIMYTRFGEKYGETSSKATLMRYLKVPMENLALVTPIVVGLIFLALPLFSRVFLPEYSEGIVPARILMFGLLFYAMAVMPGNMLLTLNRQRLRLLILSFSIILNLGLSYAALACGYGIVGVAAGTTLAYFAFFMAILTATTRQIGASFREVLVLFAKLLGPAAYVGTVTLLVDRFIIQALGMPPSLLIRTLIAEGVLIASTIYLIYKAFAGTIRGIFFKAE